MRIHFALRRARLHPHPYHHSQSTSQSSSIHKGDVKYRSGSNCMHTRSLSQKSSTTTGLVSVEKHKFNSKRFESSLAAISSALFLAIAGKEYTRAEKADEDDFGFVGEERFQFFDKILGEGSFGVVRLARDKVTGKRVAIKVVRHGHNVDVSNEIKAMKEIKDNGGHANLLDLVTVIEKPGATMIVTELVSGGEIFDRLVRKGPFSESDVAKMARSLATGIEFLHLQCSMSHCDLKPENVLFTSVKETSDLKIVDFGSARRFNSAKKFSCDIGTTVYWAPENFFWSNRSNPAQRTSFGPAADMFAIGCILYICLYGNHPFDPEGKLEEHEIAERIQNGRWKFDDNRAMISKSAKNVISSLLEVDPKKRMSASELIEHPWIRGETASQKVIAGSDARLEEFQLARKKIKAGLLAAMMQQALNDQVVEDPSSLVVKMPQRNRESAEQVLKRTFDFFDKDGKGFITPQDVSKGMADLGDNKFSARDAGTVISAMNRLAQDKNVTSHREKRFSFKTILKETLTKGAESIMFQDVVEILSEIPRKIYRDGQVVFRQHDKPDNFYFIMSGDVNVFVESGSGGRVHTATLGPGNFFGEGGMLSGNPRTATIQCSGPVELLVLSKADFDALKGDSAFNKTEGSMKDLVVGRALGRLHALFTSSPDCTSVSLQPNEILFKKGDTGEEVFVVNSGEIELHENNSKLSGEVIKVGAGSMFGETALMTGKPRNALAICSSKDGCSLSRLTKEPFLQIVGQIDSAAAMIRTRKSASFLKSEGDALTEVKR